MRASSRKNGARRRESGREPIRRACRRFLKGLDEAYPTATCALKHENPFQLLISTILSAQCTDVLVNQVTATLYRKYPTPEALGLRESFGARAGHSPHGILPQQNEIDHGREQENRRGISRRGAANHGGAAHACPASARKTANVVLGTAFGIASGVVVDTHVIRLSHRLDLTKTRRPQENRAGSDGHPSAGPLDPLFAPVDLARPPRLPGAPPRVHRMQSQQAVLFERQDHLNTSSERRGSAFIWYARM